MKNPSLVAALFAAMAPAVASAALPCYPPARFTVSAADVIDGKTGLVWQRSGAPTPRTWAQARAYCSTVGANFRLPSVKELLTIVDLLRTNPAIDSSVFSGTGTAGVYWTSTSSLISSSDVWIIDFQYGEMSHLDGSLEAQVRCVR